MIFIKTLNDIRVEKNLTLKDIAQALDISEPYCSLLLSGKRRMSLDNAKKLAKILERSIDEIHMLYQVSKNKGAVE